MKALLFLALLLLFLPVIALAQNASPAQPAVPSKDLMGWQQTRWGMSTSEVLQAVTPTPVRLEKRSYLTRGGDAGKPFDRYGYADYYTTVQVSGEEYKVYFYMDAKADRLLTVVLEPARYLSTEEYIPEGAFTGLSEALTQKYGTPTGQDDDRSKSGYTHKNMITRTRQWVFPTTSIRLHYLGLEDIPMYSLKITYSPSKNSDSL